MSIIHCYISSLYTTITLKTDEVLTDTTAKSIILLRRPNLSGVDIVIRSKHLTAVEMLCSDCCECQPFDINCSHVHQLVNERFVCERRELCNSKLVLIDVVLRIVV